MAAFAAFRLGSSASFTNMPIKATARSFLIPCLADHVLGQRVTWLLCSLPFLIIIYIGLCEINWIVIVRAVDNGRTRPLVAPKRI
jgi:hypothetical protein